jgi:hypothetical protein
MQGLGRLNAESEQPHSHDRELRKQKGWKGSQVVASHERFPRSREGGKPKIKYTFPMEGIPASLHLETLVGDAP